MSLLPENIPGLVKKNVTVLIESDAGNTSCASNLEYVDAGATIQTKENILKIADILLKINQNQDCQFHELDKLDYLRDELNLILQAGQDNFLLW